MKQALTSPPVLGYPDFKLPFQLEVDASITSIGAAISQQQERGPVVIAYASRTLKTHEQNMKNYSSMKL